MSSTSLSRGAVVQQKVVRPVPHHLDEALDIYGLSVKQVVYWKFEKTHNLSRNEIFSHPEEFVKTIRTIFGTGTSSIERDIARELQDRAGLPNTDADLVTVLRKLDRIQNQAGK